MILTGVVAALAILALITQAGVILLERIYPALKLKICGKEIVDELLG